MPNRPLIGAIAPTRLLGPSQQAMGYVVLFSPRQLFVAGEQGAWYDPSDQSTLFATHDGATPGVSVGNPVGKILDKSGRGNHATQSTLAARPILQVDENGNYYLLFDGIDDCLFTSAIDFTATDKMTVFAGVRKLSDSSRSIVIELNGGSLGGLSLAAPDATVGPNFGARISATNGGAASGLVTTYSAPITNVVTVSYSITGSSISNWLMFRVNGSSVSPSGAGTTMTGTFANGILHIGRRTNTTLQWNGRLYSLIVRGAQSTDSQITQAEAWVNRKTRAY